MMKQLAILSSSIFLMSCNLNEPSQQSSLQEPDKNHYAKELINNGFLKYADSSKIDSSKGHLSNSFDIYSDDNFKLVHIDAEELAELSFDFFLPKLNRILAKRDIKLFAHKINKNEYSFDVLINSDTIKLYIQKDLESNKFWETAPRNFFRKVNDIIREKNVDEQFYLLYGGNDLHAILLTEKQFSIIADYYKQKPKEIPYKP